MDAQRFKLLVSAAVVSCAALLVAQAHAASLLTIKGSSTEAGDTIEFPDGALLDIAVGPESITLTLPEVDIRVQCLGVRLRRATACWKLAVDQVGALPRIAMVTVFTMASTLVATLRPTAS